MAIAFVQAKETTQAAGPFTTVAATFTSNVTSGSLLVASVIWKGVGGGNETASASIADTLTSTWVAFGTAFSAGPDRNGKAWYALNSGAGADTVTVTLPGSRQFPGLIIAEYSGVKTSGALDGSSVTTGTTATGTDGVASGSIVTTVTGDLIYGCLLISNQVTATTPGTSFTERIDSTSGQQLEDRVFGSSGSTTATWTYPNATDIYFAYGAGFQAAVSATPSHYLLLMGAA